LGSGGIKLRPALDIRRIAPPRPVGKALSVVLCIALFGQPLRQTAASEARSDGKDSRGSDPFTAKALDMPFVIHCHSANPQTR
jgi:hypothetical protein